MCGNDLEIGNELCHLFMPRGIIRRAQDGRGMDSSNDRGSERRTRDDFASALRHPELGAQDGVRCGRAQADHYIRLEHCHFGLKPRSTCGDLKLVRLLVDATLTARLP